MQRLKGFGVEKKIGKRQKAHTHGIGLIGETLFQEYAMERGLTVKDTHEYALHDFLVNGKRVEVKTSQVGKHGKSYFDFTKNVGHFDILVGIVLDEIPAFYFIPESELRKQKSIGFSPHRSDYHLTQKMATFRDKWDLLT